MDKIKRYLSKNKIMLSITLISLLVIAGIIIIIFSVKSKESLSNNFVPTAQVSRKELEPVSNYVSSSTVKDTESLSEKSSSFSSSQASSDQIVLKVDGDTSSKTDKETSSKAQVKVDGNTSSKSTSSKPAEKPKPKPPVSSTPSSKPTPPPPPVSSEPESSDPLIDPPYNPDGPQHGDTIIDEGRTFYFHVGTNSYIDEYFWFNYHFGEHPEAVNSDLSNNMYKYLKHGEKHGNFIWCDICNDFVKADYWSKEQAWHKEKGDL